MTRRCRPISFFFVFLVLFFGWGGVLDFFVLVFSFFFFLFWFLREIGIGHDTETYYNGLYFVEKKEVMVV